MPSPSPSPVRRLPPLAFIARTRRDLLANVLLVLRFRLLLLALRDQPACPEGPLRPLPCLTHAWVYTCID